MRKNNGRGLTKEIKKEDIGLKTKNNDVVSFLISTLLPSILIIEEHLFLTLTVFILLQILIYTLTVRSSSILPNIMLLVLGINTYNISGGFLIAKQRNFEEGKKEFILVRIGDSDCCNTYILAVEKE
ncbi:hypothetical protein [Listeria ilorinensis]|uniref:hypothetical protein n=1 Tax=Listeria ilorinensis TaxID=2867439 RepID=UPI001EF63432|nr:hypothetical protein [Listeria ilorinensis]